jgi:hypothetical protein
MSRQYHPVARRDVAETAVVKALKELGLEGEEQPTSQHAEVILPVVHLRLLRHTMWCATLVANAREEERSVLR